MTGELLGQLLQAVWDLGKLGSVGIVSGVFSHWLSGRQHLHQQWWERRREAYTSVVEALWDKFNLEDQELEFLSQTEGARRLGAADPEAIELRARAAAADRELRRAIHAGAFLLSAEAVSLVDGYLNEVQTFTGIPDYAAEVAELRAAAKECLDRMIN